MTVHNPRLSDEYVVSVIEKPRRRRRRRVPRIRVRNLATFLVRVAMLAVIVAGLWWIIENPETAPMILGTIAGAVVVGYVGLFAIGGTLVLLGILFGTTNE